MKSAFAILAAALAITFSACSSSCPAKTTTSSCCSSGGSSGGSCDAHAHHAAKKP